MSNGFTDGCQVHEEYEIFFKYTPEAATGQRALARAAFKKLWDHWKIERRVRERNKKNVSGKCESKPLLPPAHGFFLASYTGTFSCCHTACNKIREMRHAASKSKIDYEKWCAASKAHREEITTLRKCD